MKPAPFEYRRARDAAHAVALLGEAEGDARPVAGGQSLGPMLNLRLARPALLVDIRTCPDLRGYTREDDAVVYGAAVTHAEIEDGRVPDPTGGCLAHAARRIAYRAVRNRGTLGGSIAHADPAADWLTVLLALDAEVICHGPEGARAMALADFVIGPFTTALGPGEIVVGIRVPARDEGFRFGYRKLSVKCGEFARAFSAVARDPARDRVTAVVGAVERVPLRFLGEEALVPDVHAAEALLRERLPDLDAVSRRLHGVTLARAVAALSPAGALA